MTTESSFETKYQLALQELEKASLDWTIKPPIYSLLQRLGYKQRPPYYESFGKNVWILGGQVGIFVVINNFMLYLYYTFILNREVLMPWIPGIIIGVILGAIWGVLKAYTYRSVARKHNLSSWESLGTQKTTPSS